MHKIYYLYIITNLVNQKVYVGQSIEPKNRWKAHQNAALKKPTQTIHFAMAKHGIENFTFEVIAVSFNQDDTNDTETLLVQQHESHISTGKGYNVSLGGSNAPKTEEWKAYMSEIMTGRECPWSIGNQYNLGNIQSEEVRLK